MSRWRSLPLPRTGCVRRWTTARCSTFAAAAIRWSSSALQQGGGGAFVENDCRLGEGGVPAVLPTGFDEPAAARIWLHHRPQHGRQVHVPAPERADRRAGADRIVRAGPLGAHRHRRSPVLPGRRVRRPRARPLDVHGRDGGDGRHPQSGDGARASSSSTRSGAARRPSTACPSPGPRSSTCTPSIAAARSLPPTTTR